MTIKALNLELTNNVVFCPCPTQMHNKTHTHCKHSQDFFGLLPVHNKAKGCGRHGQGVADGAGGVAVEAANVLMRDFKPLLVGIRDLSRERRDTCVQAK